MEFRFRAGDRRSRSQTPAAGFSRPCDRRVSPQAGPFHGEPPPLAQPFELEAAAWRERIIRGEVERRLLEEVCLIEEEVRRELAIARARFLGVLGPVPFVGPDGPFNMPLPPLPLPPDTLFGPGGPFLPPGPMPLMPVGMSPNWPPQASWGEWEGFDGRMGFEQLMMVNRRPPPPPKPKQKLKLREIKPSKSSKILSPEMKVSGVKRKADVISASSDPAILQNVNSAITESAGPQNVIPATFESAGLQNVIPATTESAGLQNMIPATTESAGLQNLNSATTESAGLQNVISATPEPTELQNSARNCAVYQMRSISKTKQKRYLRWEWYLKKKMALRKKQEKKNLKKKLALQKKTRGKVSEDGFLWWESCSVRCRP